MSRRATRILVEGVIDDAGEARPFPAERLARLRDQWIAEHPPAAPPAPTRSPKRKKPPPR